MSISFYKMAVTPDFSTVVVWNNVNEVKILTNYPSLTVAHTYTLPILAAGTTDKITFSQDSTLAIIETDAVNPIAILDLNTFQVVNTILILETISSAHFLNPNSNIVVVFGILNTVFVNLFDSAQYSLPITDTIIGTDLTTDRNYQIFTCLNNSL